MPTYQYACTDCGHDFEQFQSFSEDTLTQCPECEGKLRKLFNAVGVVFKGSGFYRNDSRSSATTSERPAAPAASSTPDTKKSSDSKPSAASSSSDSSSSSKSTSTPAPAAT